jgi:hypothetical protein
MDPSHTASSVSIRDLPQKGGPRAVRGVMGEHLCFQPIEPSEARELGPPSSMRHLCDDYTS